MPRIKLSNGQTADVSLDEVVIRNAQKKIIEKIPLFPERGSDSTNELENYDPMTMEFKKSGVIKGNIMGTLDEKSIQFDEKTNTVTGDFSGMRKVVENDINRFKQYNSKFSLNLETKQLTEQVEKVESPKKAPTDFFNRAPIKKLAATHARKTPGPGKA